MRYRAPDPGFFCQNRILIPARGRTFVYIHFAGGRQRSLHAEHEAEGAGGQGLCIHGAFGMYFVLYFGMDFGMNYVLYFDMYFGMNYVLYFGMYYVLYFGMYFVL